MQIKEVGKEFFVAFEKFNQALGPFKQRKEAENEMKTRRRRNKRRLGLDIKEKNGRKKSEKDTEFPVDVYS